MTHRAVGRDARKRNDGDTPAPVLSWEQAAALARLATVAPRWMRVDAREDAFWEPIPVLAHHGLVLTHEDAPLATLTSKGRAALDAYVWEGSHLSAAAYARLAELSRGPEWVLTEPDDLVLARHGLVERIILDPRLPTHDAPPSPRVARITERGRDALRERSAPAPRPVSAPRSLPAPMPEPMPKGQLRFKFNGRSLQSLSAASAQEVDWSRRSLLGRRVRLTPRAGGATRVGVVQRVDYTARDGFTVSLEGRSPVRVDEYVLELLRPLGQS